MPAQLDLSLLDTVKDPELRASIARLHSAMAAAPREQGPVLPSGAKGLLKIVQLSAPWLRPLGQAS